jgi:hypothetical protein
VQKVLYFLSKVALYNALIKNFMDMAIARGSIIEKTDCNKKA